MKKKILLVDDDSIFHFLNSKIISLAKIDCDVLNAYDGLQAMKILQEGTVPDYIFLDLDMPHMSGYEFIEAFNKSELKKKNIQIVVLTSSESESERKRVNDLGVKNYVAKPLSEQTLKDLQIQ